MPAINVKIQELLNQACDLIVAEPIDQWAGWMSYLVEALDGEALKRKLSRLEVEAFIADLVECLRQRREGGYW